MARFSYHCWFVYWCQCSINFPVVGGSNDRISIGPYGRKFRRLCGQGALFTKGRKRWSVIRRSYAQCATDHCYSRKKSYNSCVNLRPTCSCRTANRNDVNRLDRVLAEITLLTVVVLLKFCYQLTLERFVYWVIVGVWRLWLRWDTIEVRCELNAVMVNQYFMGELSPCRAREREPITGVLGQNPQRGPWAEPLVRGSGSEAPWTWKCF